MEHINCRKVNFVKANYGGIPARLISPIDIAFNQAIFVAVIGLLVNGASVWILGAHHHPEEELRAFGSLSPPLFPSLPRFPLADMPAEAVAIMHRNQNGKLWERH